ncbi:MAG: hypothetical protein HY335_09370 [Deinococcus sp.]|nr:hypothetical protein [Deinococcus sp.]
MAAGEAARKRFLIVVAALLVATSFYSAGQVPVPGRLRAAYIPLDDFDSTAGQAQVNAALDETGGEVVSAFPYVVNGTTRGFYLITRGSAGATPLRTQAFYTALTPVVVSRDPGIGEVLLNGGLRQIPDLVEVVPVEVDGTTVGVYYLFGTP